MIAPCAIHIPIGHRLPAHVTVVRGGRRLVNPPAGGPILYLQRYDLVRVAKPGRLRFTYSGNRYDTRGAPFRVACPPLLLDSATGPKRVHVLALVLNAGEIRVRAGPLPRQALVLTDEMLALATIRGTNFVVSRNPRAHGTRAWTLDQPIVAALNSHQRLRVRTRITYTAIANRSGLTLDIWPFPITLLQRSTTPADGLPAYWADGRPCSVGCTAPGATPGWPLQPFHQQHAIRAGINELRPANFHVAVDIEAHNFQPVYAIQSGYASIRYPGTGDVNVDVGNFYYWHINPTVSNGQYVVAYQTEIGQVLYGFYHLAFSEGSTSDYLNPLRPGGSLSPYTDAEPPIIGIPQIFSDGRVIEASFDPQSFVATGFSYETPVLAPSSLAWRLYDAHGNALTGLEWAMRGSQNYPPYLKSTIFAPGAANPGFECFFTQRRCIPNWVYWLAGGLTQPLPLGSLAPGRYRLTVYAWDWAGNTSALDYWIRLPLAHAASAAREVGPLSPRFDYDETGAAIPPPAPPGRP